MDWFEYEWQPVAAGGNVNLTCAVAVVDETGRLSNYNAIPDLVEGLSSQKNVQLLSPY